MEALVDDQANLAWQEHIGRHIERFMGDEDGPAGMMPARPAGRRAYRDVTNAPSSRCLPLDGAWSTGPPVTAS
jgi:hypothetical protein